MTACAGVLILAALEGKTLDGNEKRFIEAGYCSGVTLFKRNISTSFDKLSSLVSSLQSARPAPMPKLLVAIDQEGGRVARIGSPFPNLGPALELFDGRTDSESLVKLKEYGASVGESLLKLGINLNFAPVLDIHTNPENVAIGDRCFGRDSESVALRAEAFLRGMQKSAVYGCLKHFPGQGDADFDTHLQDATIALSNDELEKRELRPFTSLINDANFVMLSHCIYPALDPKNPASLSKTIIQNLLREKMGYSGIVVSDDFNMGAIPQDDKSWQDAIVASVAAGCDLILVCQNLDKCQLAYEAISEEAARSKSFEAIVQNAAARVMKIRESLTA